MPHVEVRLLLEGMCYFREYGISACFIDLFVKYFFNYSTMLYDLSVAAKVMVCTFPSVETLVWGKILNERKLQENEVLTTAMTTRLCANIIQFRIFHKIKNLSLSSPNILYEVISFLKTSFINMDHFHGLKNLTLKTKFVWE